MVPLQSAKTKQSKLRQRKYTCSECGFRSKHPKFLSTHVRYHLARSAHVCPQCSYSSDDLITVMKHYWHIHQAHPSQVRSDALPPPYRRSRGAVTINPSLQIPLHLQGGDAPRKGQDTLSTWKEKIFKYSCPDCDFQSNYPTPFSQHRKCHTTRSVHQCSWCTFSAVTPSGLNTHVRRVHHRENAFVPSAVPGRKRSLEKQRSLQLKKRVEAYKEPHRHNETSVAGRRQNIQKSAAESQENGSYGCTECAFRCHLSDNLKTHQNRHYVKSPFQCPYCTYSVNSASRLTLHMGRVHPDQPTVAVEPSWPVKQLEPHSESRFPFNQSQTTRPADHKANASVDTVVCTLQVDHGQSVPTASNATGVNQTSRLALEPMDPMGNKDCSFLVRPDGEFCSNDGANHAHQTAQSVPNDTRISRSPVTNVVQQPTAASTRQSVDPSLSKPIECHHPMKKSRFQNLNDGELIPKSTPGPCTEVQLQLNQTIGTTSSALRRSQDNIATKSVETFTPSKEQKLLSQVLAQQTSSKPVSASSSVKRRDAGSDLEAKQHQRSSGADVTRKNLDRQPRPSDGDDACDMERQYRREMKDIAKAIKENFRLIDQIESERKAALNPPERDVKVQLSLLNDSKIEAEIALHKLKCDVLTQRAALKKAESDEASATACKQLERYQRQLQLAEVKLEAIQKEMELLEMEEAKSSPHLLPVSDDLAGKLVQMIHEQRQRIEAHVAVEQKLLQYVFQKNVASMRAQKSKWLTLLDQKNVK